MHPYFALNLAAARRADVERSLTPWYLRPSRVRRTRPPARVALGIRLISVGTRLVDIRPA